MIDEDRQPDWHDHPGVVWAAGVAAVALLGLLVFAVIRVSGGSSLLPGDAPPAPTYASTSATKSTSTSTSYTVPSVQTSEDTGPPATVPSTDDDPGSDDPESATTSTTTSNPYGTTTPTNAGHV
ncbi:hypothetical protein [Mycobacterium sp. URHB0044]|uniref:hypothetical protein n=1 Tax=Mycobacterium sp. URHB0044 TaxID=1380386 RepID=UPI0006887B45|nr:hypothetical protein [Mycobacterium sp. URHB0044]